MDDAVKWNLLGNISSWSVLLDLDTYVVEAILRASSKGGLLTS